MKRILTAMLIMLFASSLAVTAPDDKEKVRKNVIKMLEDSPLQKELHTPVMIAQDKSGVISINESGNYFFQYFIQGPAACTDPKVLIVGDVAVDPAITKAVIVTHGWIDKGAGDWPADMANAFAGKTKPDEWMSLYFDWQNGAAVVNPVDAVKYSRDVAGPRLANAFLSLLPETQKLNHVHLIAHSAGTWAITTAGQIISDETGAQVHLTLLDAYLPPKWDERKLGRVVTDKPAYVEHYYSKDITFDVTQADLSAAHNVDITQVDQLVKTHEYPYKWYGATITGKFRKKDYVVDKKIITKYKDIEYGFKRSLESSPEGFAKSLELKKGNKAVVIPKPEKKKDDWFDISSWFK